MTRVNGRRLFGAEWDARSTESGKVMRAMQKAGSQRQQ